MEAIERLAREGRSILYLAVDGKLAGLIAIEDPLRPEAAPVIRKLLGRGIRVVMLTGDDERTAAAVAERLGISEYRSRYCLRTRRRSSAVFRRKATRWPCSATGSTTLRLCPPPTWG